MRMPATLVSDNGSIWHTDMQTSRVLSQCQNTKPISTFVLFIYISSAKY